MKIAMDIEKRVRAMRADGASFRCIARYCGIGKSTAQRIVNDTERGKRQRPSLSDRLFAKVQRSGGCWLWCGALTKFGYGRMRTGRKYSSSHRLSWTIHNGEIPDGLFVLHKCDVRNCVNPDHLFLGTQSDNMRDMATKGRVKGEGNGRAKLTNDQVMSIRSAALSRQQAAEVHGVTPQMISYIRSGHSWTHV